MKRNRKLLLFVSIIILLLFNLSLVYSGPDSGTVKTELNKILDEMNKENELILWLEKIISSILEFIAFIFSSFYILIIIIVVLFFIFVLYLVIRKKSILLINRGAGIKNKKDGITYREKEKPLSAEQLYQLAVSKFNKGLFSEALLGLYESSLCILENLKFIIKGRQYTNNEIRKIIKVHERYYKPFDILARQEEQIAFRGTLIAKDVCTKVFDLYKTGFIKNK